MNWRRIIKRTLADDELQQELESYIEITAEEYVARGMAPDEARLAARRKLGNATRIREEVYEMNTATFVETMIQDLRHSFRMFRLNPAFSLTAVLTLAIGIGATTVIFSIVNGVLLKPLPYPEPDQLVSLGHASNSGVMASADFLYFTYAEHTETFQASGLWAS